MQCCLILSLFKGTRPKIAYFMFRLTTGCVCVSWPNYKHLWKCWPFFVQWGPTLRNTYQELFQLQQIYLADFRCRSRLPHSYFWAGANHSVSSQTLHTCTWSPPNYSFAGSLVTARVKCLRWEHLEIFQLGEYKGEAVIKSLIGDINNCLTHFKRKYQLCLYFQIVAGPP